MKKSLMMFALMIFPVVMMSNTSSAACSGASPVWKAADVSYAEVAACVNAASNGDMVIVPKGTADWGTNTLTTAKSIKLIGAGGGDSASCNGVTSTCIRGTSALFIINTPGTPTVFPFRLSGFHLSVSGNTMGYITGAGSGWRIDHNYLHHTYGAGGIYKAVISVNANVPYWNLFGVIDGNTFRNVYVYLGGGNRAAEASWKAPAQWGTSNALFIEDNLFDGSDTAAYLSVALDSQNGGRAVVRYNKFWDMYIMAHSACQASVRGARSYEIYNNEFRNTLEPAINGPYYVHLRASSAVITDNLVTGKWTSGGSPYGIVQLDNRRSWFDAGCTKNSQCTAAGVPSACCIGPGAGTCTGTQDGLGDCNGTSLYDGNTNNRYICADQPGAGTQTGTFGSGATWSSDPIYIWNNTAGKNCVGGSNKYASCTADGDCPASTCSTYTLTPNNVRLINNSNNQPAQLVSGRDFFAGTAKSGYAKYIYPHPLTAPDPGKNLRKQ